MKWVSKDGYEIDTARLLTDLQILEQEFPHLQVRDPVFRLIQAIKEVEVFLIETDNMEKEDATITDNDTAG